MQDERAAIRELTRVARRRIAIGLLNRRSLLWLLKGRKGGRGGYRGARWHTPSEAKGLFRDLPVQCVRVLTAVHVPSGGPFARVVERLLPPRIHSGGFILVMADRAERVFNA